MNTEDKKKYCTACDLGPSHGINIYHDEIGNSHPKKEKEKGDEIAKMEHPIEYFRL